MSTYQQELQRLKIYGKQVQEKKRYQIPKKSKKKIEEEKAQRILLNGGETEKVKFFKSCMKQMNGTCIETGEPTETKVYKFAINSICHILSQQQCPSVATHPCIWIELQQDFHKKFDAMNWDEREQLKCWPIIKEKLIMVYPDLAIEERRHFPDSVFKFIEENEPFKF